MVKLTNHYLVSMGYKWWGLEITNFKLIITITNWLLQTNTNGWFQPFYKSLVQPQLSWYKWTISAGYAINLFSKNQGRCAELSLQNSIICTSCIKAAVCIDISAKQGYLSCVLWVSWLTASIDMLTWLTDIAQHRSLAVSTQ